ncbi:MAG: glycosyl hydrolase 108 family protein [Pseudomonadota bacterium]
MADFETAFEHLIQVEGGYVDDPQDSGGETYKGVARRHHPGWNGWQDIDAAKDSDDFPDNLDSISRLQQRVKQFYKSQYWDRIAGDRIPDQTIAEEVFDTGVNMGMRRAARFLQESINLLDRNQTPGLVVDGDIGTKTLRALKSSIAADRSNRWVVLFLNLFQGQRYIEVLKLNPVNEKFARGWLKRVQINSG